MGNGFSEPSIKEVKQVEIKPEWHEENRLALKQLIIKCLDVLNTDNQITLYINNHIYREGHRVVSNKKILETLKEIIHQPFTYHTIEQGSRIYLVIAFIQN